MEDITSGISITSTSETAFNVSYTPFTIPSPGTAVSSTFTTLSDPIIKDASNNIIGVSVGNTSDFVIHYTDQDYFGDVKIVIPAFSIFVDFTKTNFTEIIFTFTKSKPIITYIFPPDGPSNEIGFKTGICLEIKFTNVPTMRVPLDIVSSVSLIGMSMTEGIFYHEPDKSLYFVSPELHGVYCEKIILKPIAGPGVPGQTIQFSVEDTPGICQFPPFPAVKTYTIVSSGTTTISNMTKNIMTNVWEASVPCTNIYNKLFQYSVLSQDCEPNFILNNFTTSPTDYFIVDSNGCVSKKPGVDIPDGTYAISITITTIFGETLQTCLSVCIQGIMSPMLLQGINLDLCRDRTIGAVINFYCPEGECNTYTLSFGVIFSLDRVFGSFLQIIDIIVQNTINPDFKTTEVDKPLLADAITADSLIDFGNVIRSKLTISGGSRIDTKVKYFEETMFSFFKSVLNRFLNHSDKSHTMRLDGEGLKFKLEIYIV